MTELPKIEISGGWGSLAGTYNGREYRLKIELTPGAEDIALDEDDAQRLGFWLSNAAAEDRKRQQAERQWRPADGKRG